MLYEVITIGELFRFERIYYQIIVAGVDADNHAFIDLGSGPNQHLAAFLEVEERIPRITSYNVCYTKLLRFNNAIVEGILSLASFNKNFCTILRDTNTQKLEFLLNRNNFV